MMVDFLQFAVIMAVVMLGFAVSFFALFRDSSTWLNVFNAMLGDGFFEDFDGEVYEAVGTTLLVIYLIVTAILLLNLLIAVLSTSHANVQENADREFKVSKAHFVQHYRMVVEADFLPPPFNLLCFPSWLWKFLYPGTQQVVNPAQRENRFIGRLVFWVILSPLAVIAGSGVWMVSAPFCTYWRRNFSFSLADVNVRAGVQKAGRCLCVFFSCIFGDPGCLLGMWVFTSVSEVFSWIRSAYGWIARKVRAPCSGPGSSSPCFSRNRPVQVIGVNTMLKETPGGLVARDLGRFLADPMSDPEVRQDETTRPTTVEHIKLLRNRLETETRNSIESLRKGLLESLREEVTTLAGTADGRFATTNNRLDKIETGLRVTDQKLQEILASVTAMAYPCVVGGSPASNDSIQSPTEAKAAGERQAEERRRRVSGKGDATAAAAAGGDVTKGSEAEENKRVGWGVVAPAACAAEEQGPREGETRRLDKKGWALEAKGSREGERALLGGEVVSVTTLAAEAKKGSGEGEEEPGAEEMEAEGGSAGSCGDGKGGTAAAGAAEEAVAGNMGG